MNNKITGKLLLKLDKVSKSNLYLFKIATWFNRATGKPFSQKFSQAWAISTHVVFVKKNKWNAEIAVKLKSL